MKPGHLILSLKQITFMLFLFLPGCSDVLSKLDAKMEMSAAPIIEIPTDSAKDDADILKLWTDSAMTKDERNQTQYKLISKSEAICNKYKQRMFDLDAGRRIGLKSISLGTAAAATIVGSELAKSVLAAVSGTALGINETINAEYFYNSMMPQVQVTIKSQRDQIINDIASKTSKDFSEYPPRQALFDALRFHSACSIANALTIMSASLQKPTLNPDALKAEKREKMSEIDKIKKDINNSPTQAEDRSRILLLQTRINNIDAILSAIQ